MSNKVSNGIKHRSTKNDVFYTPKPIALQMMELCDITPTLSVLDPCYGGGVFYDNLPECKKNYCEIEKGLDFFDWNERVDLIIGNPPYSLWNKWLDHTMELTDKFCYIFGMLNFTDDRLRRITGNGFSLTKIHVLKVEWWFGSSIVAVFEKNKPSFLTVEPSRIYCDICNNYKCKRGKNGNDPNRCTLILDIS